MSRVPPGRGPVAYHTLPAAAGPVGTLLDHLAARFPAVGRETWRRRFGSGRIRSDDGRVLGEEEPYREGLRILYEREVEGEEEPIDPVPLVYEDERIVVADKPPGVPVVPAGAWVRRSLLHRLIRQTGEPDLAPAHRIDRDTAGLVLFVRRPADRSAYQALFAERRMHKVYEADGSCGEGARGGGLGSAVWVAGGAGPFGRVGPFGRDPADPRSAFLTVRSRIVRTSDPFRWRSVADPEGEAVSDVYLRARHGAGLRFLVVPRSGRPHQVRLHLAGLGFPILGDRLYPERSEPAGPLHLLAAELAFRDPRTGQRRFLASRRRLGEGEGEGASR